MEIELTTDLPDDPRLGREVILLEESRRRGYEVRGTLTRIGRFKDGDEDWEVTVNDWHCMAHPSFFRLIEE